MDVMARIDDIVARLKKADWKGREAIKDELLELAKAHHDDALERKLDEVRKGLSLELRWEIDEVVEALQPEPEPEPEEEDDAPEDEEPADGQLRMSDLKEVYADPRGLALFTDKSGTRWFAQQPDPYTGQPVMMEVPPQQVDQLKQQLAGSPYWTLGSGVVPR